MFAFINFFTDLLTNNVSARICGTIIVRCSFSPIYIYEAETRKKMKSKFFKICVG